MFKKKEEPQFLPEAKDFWVSLRRYNMKLYDEWERGDEYNRPLTVEQIGYSREALREAVLDALKERK